MNSNATIDNQLNTKQNGNQNAPATLNEDSTNGGNNECVSGHKRRLDAVVLGPKNAQCISKDGMICCPCSEGIKYSYFAPTQCYVPMEYYVPVQCCVPVECEIRYGTPFIPGKDNPASNCN